MRKYVVRYQETYSGDYEIQAGSPNEAKKIVFNDIVEGRVAPPDECCNSECYVVSESVDIRESRMENQRIETCEYELMDVIGVVASTIYDLDNEDVARLREGVSDIVFMNIVAEISDRVLDHLTGRKKVDAELLSGARSIREMYENIQEEVTS